MIWEHDERNYRVIDHMMVRKGSDRIINRGEWNGTREDKGWIVMIRDIGSLRGLGVGSEVKDRMGLNMNSYHEKFGFRRQISNSTIISPKTLC